MSLKHQSCRADFIQEKKNLKIVKMMGEEGKCYKKQCFKVFFTVSLFLNDKSFLSHSLSRTASPGKWA